MRINKIKRIFYEQANLIFGPYGGMPKSWKVEIEKRKGGPFKGIQIRICAPIGDQTACIIRNFSEKGFYFFRMSEEQEPFLTHDIFRMIMQFRGYCTRVCLEKAFIKRGSKSE